MPRRPENLTPFGRRVVTALVYADKTQARLAEHLNVDAKTLQRALRGERDFRDEEVRKILALTGVPEWFLREGFEGAPTAEGLPSAARSILDEFQRVNVEFQQEIENLRAEVLRLRGEQPAPMPASAER